MTWLKQKRLFRGSLLLVLALLVPLFLLPLAHADTYVGYGSANQGASTCGSNCENPQDTGNGIGETVQAPFTGTLSSAGFFTGSATPSKVVVLTFPVGSTPPFTTYSCGSAGTCAFANVGSTFTVQDVETISGAVANSFNTIALANPVSTTVNQWVAIVFMGGAASSILMLAGAGGSSSVLDTEFSFGSTNPNVGGTFSTCRSGCTGGGIPSAGIVGGTFTAQGTTGGTVTVTQCYGNCGSPAITLANTNSTHDNTGGSNFNFNQSVTMLYEFQANVNGFLLNVTTNLAKSYSNGEILRLAVYTIASCPQGQTPFSSQCPGLLTSAGSTQNLVKGKNSVAGLKVAVSNGQWIGIAVSALFSGLDLNDTNTNVALFQTNEGSIPALIQNAVGIGNSKMGLWAWIVGNVVSGGPSTTPTIGCGGPGLDSQLTCAVNALCTVVTSACQTGSSFFLIIILSVISLVVLLAAFSYLLPNMAISTKGLGEFSIVVFIGWFLTFALFNLILSWVVVLFIFAITWLFIGRLKGSGPI